jgi:hypothetical protein
MYIQGLSNLLWALASLDIHPPKGWLKSYWQVTRDWCFLGV